jgi:uncharacterized protein (TIGR02145 family)
LKNLFLFLAAFLLVFSGCKKNRASKPEGPNIPSFLTDIDGSKYGYVTIGNQTWMTSNLRVSHYRNGDPIVNGTKDMNWEIKSNPGAYSFPNGDSKNDETYGKYYNIQAIKDPRNIAPKGWHIASDEEWKVLEINQGMSRLDADDINHKFIRGNIAMKLMADGSSGLNLQKSGYFQLGEHQFFNQAGFYWTSSRDEEDPFRGNWIRAVNFADNISVIRTSKLTFGFSVRCIKDYQVN